MRAAVLAGGAASRLGGHPKGLEEVGGARMLDRVVEAVYGASGSPPVLVTSHPDAPRWRPDLTVVPDALPRSGSLTGIYTALTAGDGPVLLVAWDMPFITAALLQTLVRRSAGYDVFLPESGGPRRLEPLCGVYDQDCMEPIRHRIALGDLRTIGFHSDVRVGVLPRHEVEVYGDPKVLFFNVNTAAELERARRMAGETG